MFLSLLLERLKVLIFKEVEGFCYCFLMLKVFFISFECWKFLLLFLNVEGFYFWMYIKIMYMKQDFFKSI
jgi:hypothetical protein